MISRKPIFSLISVLTLAACSSTTSIKPFSSDGCSSFPEGTVEQQDLWLACCTAHDVAYWKGGTYGERLDADKQLQSCVAGVGEPGIAAIMLAGVRVGGTSFLPTSFRWGYGWPYPRFYKELSLEEKEQIEHLSSCAEQNYSPLKCNIASGE